MPAPSWPHQPRCPTEMPGLRLTEFVASYRGDPDRFPSTDGRYRCGISLWIAISLSPGYPTNSDTRLHGGHPAATAIAGHVPFRGSPGGKFGARMVTEIVDNPQEKARPTSSWPRPRSFRGRKPRQCCALRPDSGNSDCWPVCAATEPGRVWEDRLSDPIRVRNVPCRDAPPAHLAPPARSRGARGCPSCGGWRVLASACILIGPARAVMRPYRSWPRWIMECAHARRSRRRS